MFGDLINATTGLPEEGGGSGGGGGGGGGGDIPDEPVDQL